MKKIDATVSRSKLQFCMAGIKVIEYMCDSEGRHPDVSKVAKILKWPPLNDIITARVFIGVCVYFRIWIEYFTLIAIPIYILFKKEVEFRWE